MTNSRSGQAGHLILSLAILGLCILAIPTFGEEIKVIGQIDSLYRNRVSLRVLEVVSPASAATSIKVGDHVSFTLPKASTRRDKHPIGFGNVIEANLEGNIATEYAQTSSASVSAAPAAQGATVKSDNSPAVMLWTAKTAERVRNPRKYLESEEGEDKGNVKGKGKGKGRRHRKGKGKDKDDPQTWTQEEVVSAQILLKNKRVYLKEDRLRPRDKGLDVLNDEWYEKLKSYEGQKVVVYGTTHRTSMSSGTVEIKNLMKIYPK